MESLPSQQIPPTNVRLVSRLTVMIRCHVKAAPLLCQANGAVDTKNRPKAWYSSCALVIRGLDKSDRNYRRSFALDRRLPAAASTPRSCALGRAFSTLVFVPAPLSLRRL